MRAIIATLPVELIDPRVRDGDEYGGEGASDRAARSGERAWLTRGGSSDFVHAPDERVVIDQRRRRSR